jgi:hypothetical protein
MTTFRDLVVGDSFAWIGEDSRCRKTSARTYVAIEGEEEPRTMQVDSTNARVQHVIRRPLNNGRGQ